MNHGGTGMLERAQWKEELDTYRSIQKMFILEGNVSDLQILSEDIKNGTSSIYDITNPDFDALAEKIRADYVNHPPKYVINNQQREKIRQKNRVD